ncbi:MAG: Rpn family recombination-promoting nuclease/putative transposase [Cyanobacteria bacterium P01_H01_bin.15]
MAKKKADLGSKRLIGLAPQTWSQWVTDLEIDTCEIVTPEFQWVGREGDVLIRAQNSQYGEFLIANELQFRYSPKMPRRMNAYAALACEKYQLPVYPILVNILPPSETTQIRDCHEETFVGLTSRQDYRVINLWKVKAEMVLARSLKTLLPFIPIMEGGAEEPIIQEALRELRADEDLREMESLLAYFASFVLDSELVAQIMRWDMAVIRESPWYQEAQQRGIQIGEERGIKIGAEQKQQEIALNLLQLGIQIPQIAEATGLTAEQIQQLQSRN